MNALVVPANENVIVHHAVSQLGVEETVQDDRTSLLLADRTGVELAAKAQDLRGLTVR